MVEVPTSPGTRAEDWSELLGEGEWVVLVPVKRGVTGVNVDSRKDNISITRKLMRYESGLDLVATRFVELIFCIWLGCFYTRDGGRRVRLDREIGRKARGMIRREPDQVGGGDLKWEQGNRTKQWGSWEMS